MKQKNLQFGRHNEPTIKFKASRRTPTGIVPYDLTNKQVKCVVKASAKVSDSQARAVMGTQQGGISVPTPETGEILLHVSANATEEAGKFFYHLDLIEGGKPVTVLYGVWLVRDL